MFAQIGVYLVDAVFGFFVFMLLARFHFQWLRVPFRNPVGEFVLATTNWMVMPAAPRDPGARRPRPRDAAARLAAADAEPVAAGRDPSAPSPARSALAAVAAVDLLRYSLYILVFALIVQVVLSWVNPVRARSRRCSTAIDAALPAAAPPLRPADGQHRPVAARPVHHPAGGAAAGRALRVAAATL